MMERASTFVFLLEMTLSLKCYILDKVEKVS